MTRVRATFGKGKAIATVDGELVCETDIMFALGEATNKEIRRPLKCGGYYYKLLYRKSNESSGLIQALFYAFFLITVIKNIQVCTPFG